MYSLENLLNDLRQALRNSDLRAVAEVVRHAIREKPFVPEVGSSQLLHTEPGLTVLHTVVNPGFVSPPHDHRTWAVIGVYDGQEDNVF
jgi:predicted metal-dependent enzyme (double-stranded beta helix superfamily)